MEIKNFVCGSYSNNCHVINQENNTDAIIIDPGAANQMLESYLAQKKLNIKYIIITHGHGDHTGGIYRIKELFPECKIIASKKEAKFLYNRDLSFGPGGIVADINVDDMQEEELCDIKLQFISTPGHTPGGMCIYIKSENVLFSGDTLFYCSIGRTDLPGGNFSDIVNSIKTKLYVLPDNTRVLCGHALATTIAREKEFNPFVN